MQVLHQGTSCKHNFMVLPSFPILVFPCQFYTVACCLFVLQIPLKEFFPGGWWDEISGKHIWLKDHAWPSKPAQALVATMKPEILEAMKTMVETRRFPNFFSMIGFSDLANLASAWDGGREAFDAKLIGLATELEGRKVDYGQECLEQPARNARVEQLFLKIWGLDHSHLQVQAPENTQTDYAIVDAMGMEDDEMAEMKATIAAITIDAISSPPAATASQGGQYTSFAPLPSPQRVEHMGLGFSQALWKLDTFNYLAPFSLNALVFLSRLTMEEVARCKANAMTGDLPYCPPGKKSFKPTLLKYPILSLLDPSKCDCTHPTMWQKKIRSAPEFDLKGLRKCWNVGRPYLRCQCVSERKRDCGNGPIWVDHAIWYLLAHPDVLFPNVASVKMKTSMFIHFLRVSWKEAIGACVTFMFVRETMTEVITALERDPSLTAEIVIDRSKWKYNTPLIIGRILLPTRITGNPREELFEQEDGGCMTRLPSGRLTWRRKKLDRKEFIHVRYTSRLMEAVSLRGLVLEGVKQVVGERSGGWLDEVTIGWKYDEPLGAKLCKPCKVFGKFKMAEWEAKYDPEYCRCGAGRHVDFLCPASMRMLPAGRSMHIITNDTGITNNGQLQLMLNAGLNHIPMRALDEDFAMAEIEEALDCILATSTYDVELSMEEEKQVKKFVMSKAKSSIPQYHSQHRHITEEPINNIPVRAEIDWLTERYLVCPTDKAPHTPTFVCVNFIRSLALERLSGPDFIALQQPPSAIEQRLAEEASAIAPFRQTDEKPPLPHLMVVYKAHKESLRWITNTAGSVLSAVADECTCLLKLLAEDVQALCAGKTEAIGTEQGASPTFWWPITSIGEFVVNLPRHVSSIFTADITRCFERIPTDNSEDGLIAAIRFFVGCAMEWRRARTAWDVVAIMVSANGTLHPRWVDGQQDKDYNKLYFDEA
ncbi:hypothetical protein CBR_g50661 [Chara braunii]|uniref:Uncharacterized protein n=1 Tax=Chara braunii TaxID=69332 RepID=A0A388M748_CHABU|nr:hypothetical protein CBR_g50661 [Chara braunii]|eukprot:GBG90414.1 hypothetical protein CBR_g50661 [Chara braunii]